MSSIITEIQMIPAIEIIQLDSVLSIHSPPLYADYNIFAEHITSPIKIKYTKDTPMSKTISSTILFEIEEIKLDICLFPRGSTIPAISLSASIKITIWIIGESMVASNIKSPAAPTAFLIKLEIGRAHV